MTVKNLYPHQEPSLSLNFSKSHTIDPRISFTRPSSSSYLKINGTVGYSVSEEPRLDFNYSSGDVGLLVEEQRTNFLNYSNNLASAAWASVRNQVIANAGTAPNGTNTANKVIPNTEENSHFSYQVVNFESGYSYTFSVFAKQQELKYLQIHFGLTPFPNRPHANFDLSSGTIVLIQGNATASVEKIGNDWYRCSVTALSTESASSFVGMTAYNNSGVFTRNEPFIGDGVSGMLLWGAQLEKGTHSTSFIETTSAQITRAADVFSIINSNFSSWFNQTEGCFVVELDRQKLNYSQSNQNIIHMDDGSSLNVIDLYISTSNNICLKVKKNNVVTVDIVGDIIPLNKTTIAFTFKDNSFNILMKGKSPKLAATGELPVVNRLLLCADSDNITSSSTRIGSLRFYKYAVRSLQLEYLMN